MIYYVLFFFIEQKLFTIVAVIYFDGLKLYQKIWNRSKPRQLEVKQDLQVKLNSFVLVRSDFRV